MIIFGIISTAVAFAARHVHGHVFQVNVFAALANGLEIQIDLKQRRSYQIFSAYFNANAKNYSVSSKIHSSDQKRGKHISNNWFQLTSAMLFDLNLIG